MKKEPLSPNAIRRSILLTAKMSIEKKLERSKTQVANKSEVLKAHDPMKHTQSSGAKKRLNLEAACEHRDMLEAELDQCLLMIQELGSL